MKRYDDDDYDVIEIRPPSAIRSAWWALWAIIWFFVLRGLLMGAVVLMLFIGYAIYVWNTATPEMMQRAQQYYEANH